MNIALAQINTKAGDIAFNKDKIIGCISRAMNNHIDLLVFPQLSISGGPLYDIAGMPDFIDKCYAALEDICSAATDIDVLVGMPVVSGDDTFNAAVHISRGTVKGYYSKAMPFDRSELPFFAGVDSPYFYDEEALEQEGMPEYMIMCGNKKVLISLGDDLQFIDTLPCFTPSERDERPDCIVHMAQKVFFHDIIEDDLEYLSGLAADLQVPLVSVNGVGGNTDVVFYGSSAVFNAKGQLIRKLKNFEEDFAEVDLSPDFRNKIISLPVKSASAKVRHAYKAIALGMKDFFEKQGFTSACLGLSGGIDSAVVAAIAVDVLGPDRVYAVMMPSRFSSEHSVSDARQLAKNLGISCDKISIEPVYDVFISSLNPVFKGLPFSVAEENLQARIRGTLMMAVSNKFGHLLLNTTNKSEAAVGYGTLYGDSCGALSLLGDLYKTEVYELAEYINRNGEIIPKNIILKAPSAELREGQKDSDSLPEYDVLDKILYHLIEDNMSVLEVMSEGFELESVQRAACLLKSAEHKRHQFAPVIKVSRCTLGKDRIIPIVSNY